MNPDESKLFRPEALQHRLRSEEGRGLIRVSPPWTWALLLALLAALASALALAILGRVEVNGRARGILRPRAGVRILASQVDGTVGRIEARSGQPVRRGAVIARIEAPPVLAQLLEARRMTEAVRQDYLAAAALQDRAHAEQEARLGARLARLRDAGASCRLSLERAERDQQRSLALEREGIISPAAMDQAREALAEAQRRLNRTEQDLAHASQERAALASQRQEQLWQRRQTIRGAETREQAVAFLLGQTVLEAPEDGMVEAMLVRTGEAVQAGRPICKLIPREAALHVVAFLDEKDRAFVRPGDEAHLELDQLPYAEYGTVLARVERISDDLAAPFEIQEAMGHAQLPAAQTFRVELAISGDQAARRAGVPLRSGMVLNARFTLRRHRLITLVLDPLRKWLR